VSRHKILGDRRVTLSGGVASCPQDAHERAELERKADAALYWCKRNGKNLCAVAGEMTTSEDGTGDTTLAHLYALVETIDAQHLHTRDHSENVAAYAVAVGQVLGLEPDRIVRLRRAGFLHDVGKVAVRGHILEKPGALDDAEWLEMRLHPTVGAAMLQHAGLTEEASWVRHHHERIDGGGYPDRLPGSEIPFEAKILFVADSFEAMTSDRPYREGMEVEDALAELERCAGTQFDPDVVEALVGLVRRGDLAVLSMRGETVPAVS
jgi:putative nucleotidyltransferase with HDIG domain